MTDTERPAQVARYRSVPPSRAHLMEARSGVLFCFVQSCEAPRSSLVQPQFSKPTLTGYQGMVS